MSWLQPSWSERPSTDRPITLTLRLSNSGLSAATRPSSVVQTGVKSLGCENSTPQLLPRYWWNEIGPSVVSAVKSGASSPSCSAMIALRDCVLISVLADARKTGKHTGHQIARSFRRARGGAGSGFLSVIRADRTQRRDRDAERGGHDHRDP